MLPRHLEILMHTATRSETPTHAWLSTSVLVFAALGTCTAAGAQDTVSFWWDGELREATTDESFQLLGIMPNASAEARFALDEIGATDFEYLEHIQDPALGYFAREVASGTPPLGGSIRDLITELTQIASPSQIFWTTGFHTDCWWLMPWPYVELEVEPGTTTGQVHHLAQQGGGSVHAWIDATNVLLRGPSRNVFAHLDFANALLETEFVVQSEPSITWQACGGPSGDPTTGGGPVIPPAAGAPSVLEIPTLGEFALALLAALLGGLALWRLRSRARS